MRILRGQSNRDVSASGFALFVVGLVFATFLGGAVRTLLRSDQIHSRVVTALKQKLPRQSFNIVGTELLLSRGIWPALGLKLRGVTVKQATCDKLSFILEVPELILPIEFVGLVLGEFRLGRVEIPRGNLHLDFKKCEPMPTAIDAKLKADIVPPTAPKWTPSPAQINWKEAGRNFSGIEVMDLSITYERNETWKIKVHDAAVDFGEELDAHAHLEIQKSLAFGTLSRNLEFEAQSEDENLHWNVQSDFKEGHVTWTGNWDLKHDAYLTQIQLQQVPLKDAMAEIYQMGFLEREVQMKATWLSCNATWEGQVKNWTEMPLKVRNCRLEGSYGQALLEGADFFPWAKSPFINPVRLQVQRLQIQPVLEAMNRELLPAVLPRLGVWSGIFEFANWQSWNLDGFLEGVEIVFSNQSIRGKQLLNRIHTIASRSADRVVVKVDDVEVQDGLAEGQVDFVLSDDWRSGTFSVQFTELMFSPNIQNLLIDGSAQPFKVMGEGVLQGGELRQWKGTVESRGLVSRGWKLDGLKVSSKYDPGVFHMDITTDSLGLDDRWTLFTELKPLLQPEATQALWTGLKARVEIQAAGGNAQLVSATEAAGRKWRGRGNWVRDGQLRGQVSVSGPGRDLSASVLGQNGILQILLQ